MKQWMIDADGWFVQVIDSEVEQGGVTVAPPPQTQMGTYLRWQDGAWSWQHAPLWGFNCAGRIEIVEITGEEFRTQPNDVTIRMDGILGVEVKFLTKDGGPSDLTAKFHMPMRSRDGRERLILVDVVDGKAIFTVRMPTSGVWSVTEEGISSELPERFSFDGLTIRVVE